MNNIRLNSKNWQRVRVNMKSKILTFTNDKTYKTESDCKIDINSTQYIAINKRKFDKMVFEGWIIAGQDTEQEQNAPTQPKIEQIDLTGNPEVEESIRQYYVAKKSKQAIQWGKPSQVEDSWKLSNIDHSGLTKVLGADKLDSMKASVGKSFEKYNKRRE